MAEQSGWLKTQVGVSRIGLAALICLGTAACTTDPANEGGEAYDADGKFIADLPDFYDDPAFILYDKSIGDVRVTDTKLSCEAAARPDVAEEYQNYCVECQVSYVDEDTTLTYVIPIFAVDAETIADRVADGGVGLAFSGARLDAPPRPTQF